MKRAIALLLLLASCSKEEDAAAPAPAPTSPALRSVSQWKAGETDLTLSINDSVRPIAFRGRPLRVSISSGEK